MSACTRPHTPHTHTHAHTHTHERMHARLQAEKALRAKMGDAAWDALSDAARTEKLRVHQLDCWQHLRNIMLSAMSAAQVANSPACTQYFRFTRS